MALCPVLFGLWGIASLHLQNVPMGSLESPHAGWDRMERGTPHCGKTSELPVPLGVNDFILMASKQQSRLN